MKNNKKWRPDGLHPSFKIDETFTVLSTEMNPTLDFIREVTKVTNVDLYKFLFRKTNGFHYSWMISPILEAEVESYVECLDEDSFSLSVVIYKVNQPVLELHMGCALSSDYVAQWKPLSGATLDEINKIRDEIYYAILKERM